MKKFVPPKADIRFFSETGIFMSATPAYSSVDKDIDDNWTPLF